MKIVFFGTPDYVIPIVTVLMNNYSLSGVVTAPDTKIGRKKIMTPSPVKQAVMEENTAKNLTILSPDSFTAGIYDQLLKLTPDLFIVASYGKIIPENILTIPKYGALNIHPSLLPLYRGSSPIQTAIRNGEKVSGVTIIKMDKKIDHGPILFQKKLPINPSDTFESVRNRFFKEASHVLCDTITGYIEEKIIPQKQDDSKATFTKILSRVDGFIDPMGKKSKDEINRIIRAYYPWPGAWTIFDNKIIKLFPNNMVQLEGKKKVTVAMFLQGYPDAKQLFEELYLE